MSKSVCGSRRMRMERGKGGIARKEERGGGVEDLVDRFFFLFLPFKIL